MLRIFSFENTTYLSKKKIKIFVYGGKLLLYAG